MQGRPGFAWEGGEHSAWALPPAAAGAWRVTGFYLSFLLPLTAWMTGVLWGGVVLWAATCNSHYPALEMQQRHKPLLPCLCHRHPIAPGQMVMTFAAFSALSSPPA